MENPETPGNPGNDTVKKSILNQNRGILRKYIDFGAKKFCWRQTKLLASKNNSGVQTNLAPANCFCAKQMILAAETKLQPNVVS